MRNVPASAVVASCTHVDRVPGKGHVLVIGLHAVVTAALVVAERKAASVRCPAPLAVLVADIVNAGANTNLLDGDGRAAMHVAIDLCSKAGNAMALHILSAEQTDVDLATALGLRPLLLSVQTRNLVLVKALLERDADPNLLSAGAGPLHTALLQLPGERGAAEAGVSKKALAASKKTLGAPKALAMSASEVIALEILRNGQADVNLRDGLGRRPVFLSVSCCSTLVLDELLKQKVGRDG